MRKSLLALLLLAAASLAQAQVQLRDGYPQRYTVIQGDTLWDIAGKFLSKPWEWPHIWHANPQVANPDFIYPGDTLVLSFAGGQPQISLQRGESRGTIKLSPRARSTPVAEAIPTIPLGSINAFLLANRVVQSPEEFEQAPYIVAGNQERVLSGQGDRIYARGHFDPQHTVYGIFRQGKTYTDPATHEVLGINADNLGGGEVVATEGDIATLSLQSSNAEVRLGDRLFSTEERPVNSFFYPAAPTREVHGTIIDVPRGVTQIGKYDVVTLDRGSRDGLQEGNVLAIYKTGEIVRDRVNGEQVKIPDERAGLLMVFRTYEKLSYGLVLNATRSLAVMDKVANP
ncbi:LysM peptidoglycan-binding domain-containing protein [Pseudomonas typographi]|uniref:LysM peptidoglycan-binding domain-containing protein n=1 Tax=Pseudomonas typographi TaxID=2715964 RepID=A0ABR7Z4M7_9PSED|nr:LysM domain-containing protein [Pseudomonas typographi]MBD1552900.1 LysM peptidoglycan-binding domain-containing protein [Pseudomonas typographi]MBD1600246.1 LysM peptidoglycan-binding domain-containing protein [Pseudomonas typographi]